MYGYFHQQFNIGTARIWGHISFQTDDPGQMKALGNLTGGTAATVRGTIESITFNRVRFSSRPDKPAPTAPYDFSIYIRLTGASFSKQPPSEPEPDAPVNGGVWDDTTPMRQFPSEAPPRSPADPPRPSPAGASGR